MIVQYQNKVENGLNQHIYSKHLITKITIKKKKKVNIYEYNPISNYSQRKLYKRLKLKRCGVIANETDIHQIHSDVNNNKSLYDLQH